MPILTIAIPTYNSSKYLKETLEKTIIQCEKNNEIEILVSDNCSTDDTESVVKDFINKEINIRYLKNSQNVGLDKNVKTYIFSFANPVVTIRFGNQRWATEGGAIGYFYNVINIYKDLCKKGYKNEYFIIKNLFISKIINPLIMKYDSSMLNLKYALLFLPIYSGQIREYVKFVKALVFTKRQAFSGGGN